MKQGTRLQLDTKAFQVLRFLLKSICITKGAGTEALPRQCKSRIKPQLKHKKNEAGSYERLDVHIGI
jgi:hypothetical protein